jgi:ABC-type polysaccharide/polyol phosphate transport system ATPase subunit
VPSELILVDRVGKKFHRTLSSAFAGGLRSMARKALRLKPGEALGRDEFWALKEVSFTVRRGECLGVIGPNGAGKSTLLKLIHREFCPDEGRLFALGAVKSLIHVGTGLQPLLSGRENIFVQCQQMGLGKREADARLDGIVDFAGLAEAIDAPVKTYSDGMYARLEFAIATSVQADILLVDEVLAMGDIAFQIRALDRLNQLKRGGAAIVFVSHSEMNVLHVADRCLLLFSGRQVALGAPDALFRKYYESVGYLNERLRPLDASAHAPGELAGALAVSRLRLDSAGNGRRVRTGESLSLVLEYEAKSEFSAAVLYLEFRNAADLLVASIDSGLAKTQFRLTVGRGEIVVHVPFFSLSPGYYCLAAGFTVDGQWQAYAGHLLEIYAVRDEMPVYGGLATMEAFFQGDGLS